MKYWKVVGALVGFYLFSFFGAFLGFIIGSLFDNDSVKSEGQNQRFARGDIGFDKSLLTLMAAIMKADGSVKKSELDYTKRFMLKQFGEEKTREHLLFLREILKQNISIERTAISIRMKMAYPMRLQLLHSLFGLALADGEVSYYEIKTIRNIASYMGLSGRDYESIKAMFVKSSSSYSHSNYRGRSNSHRTSSNQGMSLTQAYAILSLKSDATERELKKTYRKMAMTYHPDKVASLGESHKLAAKEKFQKVNEAYEKIKESRGLN